MQPATVFTCPNCGGPIDGGALHCPFCRAAVATVRCARCFHMNPPHAVHCSGCGGELGLEPIGEPSSLTCPRCRARLEGFRGEPGVLCDCPECGGQFVEHALLHELLERRAVVGAFVLRMQQRPIRPAEPVRYVPCPVCDKLMNRENFGRQSGIVVDVCGVHGTWFDRGELPAVLDFVRSGALARARHAEQDARAAHAPLSACGPLHLPAAPPSSGSILDDLADAALAFAAFVRNRVRED